MGTRGRKSVADAATVIIGAFGNRPEPPADLTDRQAEIWRETAASEPPEFFNTAALRGLLKNYCRRIDEADKLSDEINAFEPEWRKSAEGSKVYRDLLKMRDLEANAAAGLATKLRLTNQARYTPQAAATASRNAVKGVRPWEV